MFNLRLAVTALLFKTIGHIEMDHCKNQTEQQRKKGQNKTE